MWQARCELREQTKNFKPEKKLLMTCRNKKEYVVHFKMFKFYLQMGMRVTRIHAVVKFRQASIFKNYIDKNSAKRQAAKSDFEKDLYKLLNNALFGKTMENVRNRNDFSLVNTRKKLIKQTSKHYYLRAH